MHFSVSTINMLKHDGLLQLLLIRRNLITNICYTGIRKCLCEKVVWTTATHLAAWTNFRSSKIKGVNLLKWFLGLVLKQEVWSYALWASMSEHWSVWPSSHICWTITPVSATSAGGKKREVRTRKVWIHRFLPTRPPTRGLSLNPKALSRPVRPVNTAACEAGRCNQKPHSPTK